MDNPFDAAFKPFPALRTERLALRRISTEDAPAIFAIFSNPVVTKYYDVDTLTDPAQADELVLYWLDRIQKHIALRWALTLPADGRLVGTGGFYEFDKDNRLGMIAIELAPEVWNGGFATEAGLAFVDFGFRAMQLNRIETWVSTGNSGSIRTLEKMGFCYEGLLRKRRYWQGEYQDVKMYALLRDEYLEMHPHAG